jgi:hypothetical protein
MRTITCKLLQLLASFRLRFVSGKLWKTGQLHVLHGF